MRSRLRTFILALAVGLTLVAAHGATPRTVVVDRAKTRVGIARVVLHMAPLTVTDEGLVGDYAIKIPLAPFMDDAGEVAFPLSGPLAEAVAPGKTLTGTATSREDGRVHRVACSFETTDRVRIVVTTKDRVLSFDAPYLVRD